MKYLEDLPPLPEPATWLIIGLLLVFWLTMRIRILRRRQARRGPDEAPFPAWDWMRTLAALPWMLPALAVLAVLLVAALVATFALAG